MKVDGGSRISRRRFVGLLGAAPLAAGGGLLLLEGGCSGLEAVRVEEGGLVLDNRVYPIFSGSLHYWQHDREIWPRLLDNLLRLGFQTLCLDIPWSVHEREDGSCDFGAVRPELDFPAFLDLAAGRNLKILARPGPRLGHEVARSGIPERVLFDPRVAARNSLGDMEMEYGHGSQYPVPSSFSQTFLEEAEHWFDRVGPLLSRHLHPRGGPVIAVQVDHESGYFGRLHYPYSLDYHLSALDRYRQWLAGKYPDIGDLNRIYGTGYHSFESVEPPRDFLAENFRELPPYLDWVDFRESSVSTWLERLGALLTERGIVGVPLFATLPPAFRAPYTPSAVESSRRIAFTGLESFSRPEDYSRERRLSRVAAGFGPLPFRSGVRLGGPPESGEQPPTPAEVEFMALTALMHGARGINFHLAAERDFWTGCPLTRDCRTRPEYYQVVQKILRFLRESGFHRYRKAARVLLLYNRGLDRLAAARERRHDNVLFDLGGEVFNEPVDLGFKNSPEACLLWLEQVSELMRGVGFDWNCADSGISSEQLADYRVVVLPAGDFHYHEELATLKRFVDRGGTLLFGPGQPGLDQSQHRNTSIESFFLSATPLDDFLEPDTGTKYGLNRLIHMESPHEIARLLKSLGISPRFTRSNGNIDLVLHENPEGSTLLFAANSTDNPHRGDVFFEGQWRIGLWGKADQTLKEGKITLDIPPYSIQVWEVRK